MDNPGSGKGTASALPAFAGLLLCAGLLLADDRPPVSLRYEFREGETVRYAVSMADKYGVQVGEFQDDPYTEQNTVKSYRVVSVNDDGSAVLELTFESIRVEMLENGEKFEFDSRKPEQQGPSKFAALAAMAGVPYLRLTISPTGEVSNTRPLLRGTQQPEELSQAALEVLLRLPEEPVQVGGKWEEDYEVAIQVPNSMLKKSVKMQRRFYLRSIEEGLATIEMRTQVLTPVRDPEEEIQLIRRTPKGTIVIDLDRGLLVSRSLEQNNRVSGFVQGPSVMDFSQKHTERRIPE